MTNFNLSCPSGWLVALEGKSAPVEKIQLPMRQPQNEKNWNYIWDYQKI